MKPGITIPDNIKRKLKKATVELLEHDGHCITFPETSGCQMRLVINGESYGGYYSYNQYGSVQKAFDAAISRCQQLRAAIEVKPRYKSNGVLFVVRDRKKISIKEYYWNVSYKKPDGRNSIKSFYCGSTLNEPTSDKVFHAYRTAVLFKYMVNCYGYSAELNSWFEPWKEIRLYTENRDCFQWDGVHEIKSKSRPTNRKTGKACA